MAHYCKCHLANQYMASWFMRIFPLFDHHPGVDEYGDQRENVSIRARCSIDCRTYNGPQPRDLSQMH